MRGCGCFLPTAVVFFLGEHAKYAGPVKASGFAAERRNLHPGIYSEKRKSILYKVLQHAGVFKVSSAITGATPGAVNIEGKDGFFILKTSE